MIGFTTAQVKQLTGLTTRQLNYYDKTGLLRPSIQRASGKGTIRYYSFRDVVALRMIAALREKGGASLQAVRAAVNYLQTVEGKALSEVVLAVQGDDIVKLEQHDPEKMVSLVTSLVKNPGQLVYIFINVGQIVREIEDAIRVAG